MKLSLLPAVLVISTVYTCGLIPLFGVNVILNVFNPSGNVAWPNWLIVEPV